MIRPVLAALLTLSFWTVAPGAGGPAPYDLEVALDFAAASGDETMREELELQVLSELRRAACFRAINRVDAAGDEEDTPRDLLRLNISVTELFEETTYDTSIAERADPLAPQELELMHTSRIRAVMSVTLEHAASDRELRSRRLRGNGSHRPLIPGEDARLVALREATSEVAQSVRLFACKGGAKRLRKEIGDPGAS